jgi:hypothetical protein
VRKVCRDEKRNCYQDDRVKNDPMNDDLCSVAVSIDVGRCIGLFRTDIWVGASCSEIRPNGNVVWVDMVRVTVVFELAEVDLNTGAGRTTNVQAEENNLLMDAWRTSSWLMELAKYLDVWCSTTAQQLRRPVGAAAQCVPNRGGGADDGGDDGDMG